MGKATGWGDFQKNWHLEHPTIDMPSFGYYPALGLYSAGQSNLLRFSFTHLYLPASKELK